MLFASERCSLCCASSRSSAISTVFRAAEVSLHTCASTTSRTMWQKHGVDIRCYARHNVLPPAGSARGDRVCTRWLDTSTVRFGNAPSSAPWTSQTGVRGREASALTAWTSGAPPKTPLAFRAMPRSTRPLPAAPLRPSSASEWTWMPLHRL